MDKQYHRTHCIGCNYLSTLGLKFTNDIKGHKGHLSNGEVYEGEVFDTKTQQNATKREALAQLLGRTYALLWRHSRRDGVSKHQAYGCLLNLLFWRRTKKTSKLCVIGLCAGNSQVTGEFPAQMASNAEMFPLDDVIMMIR